MLHAVLWKTCLSGCETMKTCLACTRTRHDTHSKLVLQGIVDGFRRRSGICWVLPATNRTCTPDYTKTKVTAGSFVWNINTWSGDSKYMKILDYITRDGYDMSLPGRFELCYHQTLYTNRKYNITFRVIYDIVYHSGSLTFWIYVLETFPNLLLYEPLLFVYIRRVGITEKLHMYDCLFSSNYVLIYKNGPADVHVQTNRSVVYSGQLNRSYITDRKTITCRDPGKAEWEESCWRI